MGNCQDGSCGMDQKRAAEQQDESIKSALGKIKHKFMVMSGKGGVGKTSVSVNLAMTLAQKGFSVGIMDVDIHGPDVPRMLGLSGEMAVGDGNKLGPLRYSDNLYAISIESLMPNKDEAVIWRGPLKHSAIRQFIADVNWGDLDFLIIDSPPGTGDEPLSVAQTIKEAQAIIVTTPQEVALADVRKSIAFCKRINMGIFGMIENMSGYVCPHCHKTVDLFGSGGGKQTAEKFGIRFLGAIPFDPNLVKAGDAGKAYIKEYGDSVMAGAFMKIADVMAGLITK